MSLFLDLVATTTKIYRTSSYVSRFCRRMIQRTE